MKFSSCPEKPCLQSIGRLEDSLPLLQAERNLFSEVLFSEVQMLVVTEGLPLGWVLSPSDHPVPVFSYLFDCSKYLGVSLGDTG